MTTVMTSFDKKNSGNRNKMLSVMSFLRKNDIPRDLARRVRVFYGHLFQHASSSKPTKDSNEVFSGLSNQLRCEVVMHIERKLISSIPFLRGKTPRFIVDTLARLEPVNMNAGETIVKQGEKSKEMYFLTKGRVAVLKDDVRLMAFVQGSYFGEFECLDAKEHSHSVRAMTACELQVMNRRDLLTLLREHPEVREELQNSRTDTFEESPNAIRDEASEMWRRKSSSYVHDMFTSASTQFTNRKASGTIGHDTLSGQRRNTLGKGSDVSAPTEENSSEASVPTLQGRPSNLMRAVSSIRPSQGTRVSGNPHGSGGLARQKSRLPNFLHPAEIPTPNGFASSSIKRAATAAVAPLPEEQKEAESTALTLEEASDRSAKRTGYQSSSSTRVERFALKTMKSSLRLQPFRSTNSDAGIERPGDSGEMPIDGSGQQGGRRKAPLKTARSSFRLQSLHNGRLLGLLEHSDGNDADQSMTSEVVPTRPARSSFRKQAVRAPSVRDMGSPENKIPARLKRATSEAVISDPPSWKTIGLESTVHKSEGDQKKGSPQRPHHGLLRNTADNQEDKSLTARHNFAKQLTDNETARPSVWVRPGERQIPPSLISPQAGSSRTGSSINEIEALMKQQLISLSTTIGSQIDTAVSNALEVRAELPHVHGATLTLSS